jgi:hypothetical protein
VPHVVEHAPHVLHAPTQSTGHSSVLQFCETAAPVAVEHATPPFATAVVTVKVRDWLPVPHVVEHVPHVFHAPTQWTGHSGVLQDCDAVRLAHATPPFASVVVIAKVRDWVPAPHVAEHVPQEPHAPTQSTGHGDVLQFCDAAVPPVVEHTTPPLATAVEIVNVRN